LVGTRAAAGRAVARAASAGSAVMVVGMVVVTAARAVVGHVAAAREGLAAASAGWELTGVAAARADHTA
jgi:hypothetical protein